MAPGNVSLPIAAGLSSLGFRTVQIHNVRQLEPNEVEQAAREAIDSGEYSLAVQLLRGPADSGNPEAQYLLGYLYFTSADVDPAESRQWLERAAAQQHAEALFHLANWPDDGTTGPPDIEYRRTLLVRAAELGSVRAQRDLGCYYARNIKAVAMS